MRAVGSVSFRAASGSTTERLAGVPGPCFERRRGPAWSDGEQDPPPHPVDVDHPLGRAPTAGPSDGTSAKHGCALPLQDSISYREDRDDDLAALDSVS
jgi:hypothetical protein